jgi:glycosyltransferase involved in cell wall biosynthesis
MMKYKNGTITANSPEILFISSYPPRECGIATYSHDLVKALNNKLKSSYKIVVCPIESEHETHQYRSEINYTLKADVRQSYLQTANNINNNKAIKIVLLQHEFGFFEKNEEDLLEFFRLLKKPIILVFHTVLKNPNPNLLINVTRLVSEVESIVVMTNFSSTILKEDYGIESDKIQVIPHGTHLVPYSDKNLLKRKHKLVGRKILSTFGLLSSGKSIETTLNALPHIIEKNPEVLFLIIGKTHPSIVKREGEIYRNFLEKTIQDLKLEKHVKFINHFLPLQELLEYLQLTDIYLFTSKDPNQAVSGTFSYAISCGCPIISTPIPHACEVLSQNAGIIVDFEDSMQLAVAVNTLLFDEQLRKNISANGIHKIASTAWENSAIAHAMLFQKIINEQFELQYSHPKINLSHIKKMTSDFGILQFSIINQPDFDSGYTLDDNARAMIALCQHFELTGNNNDLLSIQTYFKFIKFCLQKEGYFLNYVSEHKTFTEQNNTTNLADSNGRAIWALGYLISLSEIMPEDLIEEAEYTISLALENVNKIHSTRAMAFIIKGLYYRNLINKSPSDMILLKEFANRLIQMYKHEKEADWLWFESYLTYANSLLPEALLCAWMSTEDQIYKNIAKESFDFLLSKIFLKGKIKVISNKGWLYRKDKIEDHLFEQKNGGEQPIDITYTILALSKFFRVFRDEDYALKMESSFNWFLGENHLNQIIYNPCTGGCYDGLEDTYVNLNQGAESTVSYLMARLCLEKFNQEKENHFSDDNTLLLADDLILT